MSLSPNTRTPQFHSRLHYRVDEWLCREKHLILPAAFFRRELKHPSPSAVILCIVRLLRHLVWCASLLTGSEGNEPNEQNTKQQWPCEDCGFIEPNIEACWKWYDDGGYPRNILPLLYFSFFYIVFNNCEPICKLLAEFNVKCFKRF